jgi:hypothetical protein
MQKPQKKRVMHPNSIANLRPVPFAPGNNANPGGRPKGAHSPTSSLRRILAGKPGEKFQPETNADVLAQGWFVNATKGNGVALREAIDRIDGKQVQEVEQRVKLTVEEMNAEQLREHIASLIRGNRGVAPDEPAA